MIAAQLIEMLQIQDRLNRVVHPEWIKQKFPWHRAIMVETVELLDKVGWKWWKKQEMDLAGAQMEFIDIWHFVLSYALEMSEGSVQKAALALLQEWSIDPRKIKVQEHENSPVVLIADAPLQRRVELFAAMAGVNGTIAVPLLRTIADDLEIDDARIFELYMCKNALNQFRQAHGYREGTYIKVWDGREDNDVLQEIVDTIPNITFDGLLNALEIKYAALIK